MAGRALQVEVITPEGGVIKTAKSARAERRSLLYETQNGKSPLSGEPLVGRLEKHHIKEKYEGGTNQLDNLQLLPLAEHVGEHMCRAFEAGLETEEGIREFETASERVRELSPEERRQFNEFVEKQTGKKVRFY